MKSTALTSIMSLGLYVCAVSTSNAATLIYDFDAATVGGTTVLYTASSVANVSASSYTFDTSVKATGSASLQMQGQYVNTQTFGYFAPFINIGALSSNGSSQNLSLANTSMSFEYLIQNSPGFITQGAPNSASPNIQIRLFKGGTGSGGGAGGTQVAAYYTTANAGNTGDVFLTLSTSVVNGSGNLGSGWTLSTTFSDLAEISYIRIYMGWSQNATGAFVNSTLNYHLDNLQVTGAGVTAIPEPTPGELLLGGIALFGCVAFVRRRLRVS